MSAQPTQTTRRRTVLARAAVAAALSWLARAQAEDPFELVTPAEAAREAAQAPVAPRTRAMRPGPGLGAEAPQIRVIAPDLGDRALRSPLRIEVAFTAPADARIVPASFRLLYGVLKIDLTERVNRRATILESGVVVDQARVPEGTHRLIVRIADDKGRFGEQELVIRVGARPESR